MQFTYFRALACGIAIKLPSHVMFTSIVLINSVFAQASSGSCNEVAQEKKLACTAKDSNVTKYIKGAVG